jgi:metal-responsive CopG/Arc/MetJ family transcriptional regulator
MANVKTAISIQEPLFHKVEQMAAAMNVSRSRLFTLAIEQFIRDYEKQRMFETLNAVHASGLDPEDRLLLDGMRHQRRKLLEKAGDEW